MSRFNIRTGSVWKVFSVFIFLGFSGCGGGFHAVSPSGSDEDLVYRFNSETTVFSGPLNFVPKEMPSLPPGSVPIEPFTEQLREPQKQVVAPAFNPQAIAPLRDGEVTLANVNMKPYDRVGRLLMSSPSDPPNTGTLCTAQLVGDEGVLLTAAHCVFNREKREWVRTIAFQLQYDQGTVTQTFNWECAAMVSGWPNGKYTHDYAFVKLRGVPPGGLGMTINVSGSRVDAVGYPKKYYNSQRLVHVFGVRDKNNPAGMTNDMGGGSSGGGRILEAGGFTDVVSVNSFIFNDRPDYQYGPVFTATTMKAYEFTRRSCRDRVAPAGAEIAELSSVPDREKFATIESRLDVAPSFGAEISAAESESCTCGEKKTGLTLKNTSSKKRLVSIRKIKTSASEVRSGVETAYIVLQPKEVRFLGCARSNSGPDKTCDVDEQYRLLSDRLLRGDAPALPKPPAGATVAQALASSDINQCIQKCSSGSTNEFCLNLGVAAVPSLASLAKFVNVVDGGTGSPDGVVVKKDDVIKEFGGDVAAKPDVCERSDINRVGADVVNEGFGCILVTKEIAPNLGLRTRLNMRANVRGTPSAWSPALSPLVSKPTTFFTDRELAAAMDFEGDTASSEAYGGDINAASIVSDKEIVLATSNGCISGHYRKP